MNGIEYYNQFIKTNTQKSQNIKENQKHINKENIELKHKAVISGALGFSTIINIFLSKKFDKNLPFEKVEKTCDYMVDSNKKLKSKYFTHIFWEKGKTQIVDSQKGIDYSKWIDKQVKESGFYSPDPNLAIVSKDKAFQMMHEIGHAISANTFGKNWIKLTKTLPYLAVLLPIIALLPNKSDKSDSKVNNIKKKIDNNAGKISLACFAPLLLEEFLASARGLVATKKIAPELLKPVSKYYVSAYLSQALPMFIGINLIGAFPKLINNIKQLKQSPQQKLVNNQH